MNKFMETVKFYFVVVILAIVFNFIMAIPQAHALRPAPIPQSLIQEAMGVVTVYVGVCPRPAGPAKCMVGLDPETNVGWMLLADEHGVIYQVITKPSDGNEQIRWTHPAMGS